jgi:hypothetical protein
LGSGFSVADWEDGVHFHLMSNHSLLDQRALEMDRLIANRILEDSSVLDKARLTLARWLDIADESACPTLLEWKEILAGSPSRIREVLLGEDEDCKRLRQSSPFCGILTNRERTQILLQYR